ncbi:MAG: protein translocase subunit SecF [Nocardioidaceae bacterium]
MSRLGTIGARLYRGDVSIDFVGRWRTWYVVSGLIVLVAILALGFRGLNYGIEFKGGVEYNAQFPSGTDLSSKVEPIADAVVATNLDPAQSPVVVVSGDRAIRIDVKPLTLGQKQEVGTAIRQASGATEINSTVIGPTWGSAIARKALTGLIVFVVLVVLFIWAYFREWRMSVAGMVALAHDLVITIGVYALTGFEVTPATVTGLLTILGYSLYDTVVVFDKVRENTKGIASSTRRTYAAAANLAVNQTLVRSINTSIAALLPVGAILYVGTFQLGSGPLKDLALALFVGMAAGAYSSIFIATPLLAQLKMREPAMVAQAKRVASRHHPEVAPVRAGSRRETTTVGGSTAVGVAAPEVSVLGSERDDVDAPEADDQETEVPPVPGRRPSSTRPARPPVTRPMSNTAAKRAQPQRQPRSKRGKR